jgi:hypothetical protein
MILSLSINTHMIDCKNKLPEFNPAFALLTDKAKPDCLVVVSLRSIGALYQMPWRGGTVLGAHKSNQPQK